MEISPQFELKDTERTGDLLRKSAAFEKSGVSSGNYILKYRNSFTSNEEGFMEIRINYIDSKRRNVILLYNADGNRNQLESEEQTQHQQIYTKTYYQQLFYMDDYLYYVFKDKKRGPILYKILENTRARLIRLMYYSYHIFEEIHNYENRIHVKLKKCRNQRNGQNVNYYLHNTNLMNMISDSLVYTNYPSSKISNVLELNNNNNNSNESQNQINFNNYDIENINLSYKDKFNTMLRMFIFNNNYFDTKIKTIMNEPTIYEDGNDLYSFDID